MHVYYYYIDLGNKLILIKINYQNELFEALVLNLQFYGFPYYIPMYFPCDILYYHKLYLSNDSLWTYYI